MYVKFRVYHGPTLDLLVDAKVLQSFKAFQREVGNRKGVWPTMKWAGRFDASEAWDAMVAQAFQAGADE